MFDAYGTLLDVRRVEAACARGTTDPAALVDRWRAKQLEDSFDLERIHGEANP